MAELEFLSRGLDWTRNGDHDYAGYVTTMRGTLALVDNGTRRCGRESADGFPLAPRWE